ncbi:NAD(P)-binding domain-containing protein [Mesorhizobium sp. KR2-14]|uniref:NAD(P)-binding domain-containing protein n=1 Tax=Mesorhizobium sp. KR2-14 TaxID=3156610 RepID=UPI0032B371F7
MLYFAEADSRGAIEIALAAQIIDDTYRAIGEGRVHASAPSMMRIGTTPHRLGAKGAVLDHLGVAGVRLTSRAAPRLMLWSLETGEPVAFFDERTMYRFRTGVSAAVVAGYLLRARPLRRAAIIGAGPIASQIALAIHELLKPSQIVVASRSPESAERFAADCRASGLPASSAQSAPEAVHEADLVVTITTANEVLVRREHLKDGATVLSMGGGLEIDHVIWASAAVRFVDDLSYALLQGDAHAWIAGGLIDAAGFEASLSGTIGELAAGRVPDRPSDGIAMAIVQGTTALDIALAHAVYDARLNNRNN